MAEKGEKKKTSIHERTGYGPMDIYNIERAFHPRAREVLEEDVTGIVDKIFEEFVKNGRIGKDKAAEAADAFVEAFAKYHFGDEHKDLNKDQVRKILREQYGISREALRKAFEKGAYRNREAFYREHKAPIVEHADRAKKQLAQEALHEYTENEVTRDEIVEHIEQRTGKKLSDTYRKIVDLDTTVQLIGAYMGLPGAVEAIEKDNKAQIGLPEVQAGHPSIYHAFKEGDKYREAYHAEAKKVDDTHTLARREKKKAA